MGIDYGNVKVAQTQLLQPFSQQAGQAVPETIYMLKTGQNAKRKQLASMVKSKQVSYPFFRK